MSGPTPDADRHEPATPYKLERARGRGSVARSADLTLLAVLVAALLCIHALGASAVHQAAALVSRGLGALRGDLGSTAALGAHGRAMILAALAVAAPVVLALWTAACLAAGLQVRGVWSAEPMKPDLSRLNPAAGLKRVLSLKSLHQVARATAIVSVLAIAGVLWGERHLGDLLTLSASSPRALVGRALVLIGSLWAVAAAIYVGIAAADWAFQQWSFRREMRMSRRELKDEHKEREGDPRIRARLRELRLQWMRRTQSLQRVAQADVVVTNPTHIAIALEYRQGQMPAPLITAKGAGSWAARIRTEAHRRGVPVVENAPLARALYALGESETVVPEAHYVQVARLLKWIYAARATSRASASTRSASR